MKISTALALVLGMSAAVLADEVQLKNGGVVRGIAREEPGKVHVDTGVGTLTLAADDVCSVRQEDNGPIREYRERLTALGQCPSADAVFETALWTKEQHLSQFTSTLLYWTLSIDPDHAKARQMLDYVREGDRWMPRQERDELRKTRVAAQQAATTIPPSKPVRRTRPAPEISPGYVYLGIPPSLPAKGSANYGGYGGDSTFSYPYPVPGYRR